MDTSTLILGGGLSGLSLADALEWRGQDYVLADANDRFGGRICATTHDGERFDMGPTWFWPGQPRMAALVERLGLQAFPQYCQGAQTYEDHVGEIQRGRGLASMQGAVRVVGGMSAVTDALERRLPDSRKRLNAEARHIAQQDGKVAVTFADGEVLLAKRVVLALPPRLSAGLSYDPPLSPEALSSMEGVPTWMAGQAKVMAIYSNPFWRAIGLSGDAMSRLGPMVEIHDASPADGRLGALFGFIGLPAFARRDMGHLRRNVITQFGRLFGAEAAGLIALDIKDWAYDTFTATPADALGPQVQPTYGLPPAATGLWGNRLVLSGSETAPKFGGLLEGALEATEMVVHLLDGPRT